MFFAGTSVLGSLKLDKGFHGHLVEMEVIFSVVVPVNFVGDLGLLLLLVRLPSSSELLDEVGGVHVGKEALGQAGVVRSLVLRPGTGQQEEAEEDKEHHPETAGRQLTRWSEELCSFILNDGWQTSDVLTRPVNYPGMCWLGSGQILICFIIY